MASMLQKCARCLTAANNIQLLNIKTSWRVQKILYAQKQTAAAKSKAAAAQMAAPERKYFDVEEDVEKLCNYVVGANIYKDGQDPPLKPQSEYPDWLWQLRTERGPPSVDLDADPGTLSEKDEETYWRQVRKLHRKKIQLHKKIRNRFKLF